MEVESTLSIRESCINQFCSDILSRPWSNLLIRKKLHLVAWEVMCSSYNDGGIGLQSLPMKYRAFLGHAAIKVALGPRSSWSRLVYAKYRFHGSWQGYELLKTAPQFGEPSASKFINWQP